ncbi:MAG: hypothetical protein OXG81_03850 [Acidobacteria bacterium]|nr:hypothetical protein [Acidobacteriota bacterium]
MGVAHLKARLGSYIGRRFARGSMPPPAAAGGNPGGAGTRHTRNSPCARRRAHG